MTQEEIGMYFGIYYLIGVLLLGITYSIKSRKSKFLQENVDMVITTVVLGSIAWVIIVPLILKDDVKRLIK